MTPSFSSAFHSARNRALMNGRQPAVLLVGKDMERSLVLEAAEMMEVGMPFTLGDLNGTATYCDVPLHHMTFPGLALITRPTTCHIDSGFDTP